MSSADNLCKQIGTISGPTKCLPDLDPICLTQKDFFELFGKKSAASELEKFSGDKELILSVELSIFLPKNQTKLLNKLYWQYRVIHTGMRFAYM